MNALLHASVSDLWSLAGWTMVHFLWLGAIVAAVATVARVALRSASPNARYAVAIGSLFLLAALPLATAAWLVKYAPPFPLKAGAGGVTTGPIAQSATAPPTPATANDLIELHAAETPTVPGSAGGYVASGVQPPVASALPLPSNPRQSRGLPAATAVQPSASPATFNALLESCVAYLPWLWLIGTPLTFALLVSGVVGTRRLGRSSHAIDSDPIVELLAHLASSLRITRRVTVAVCDRIASPVLIGIIRPMILLPPAAITGWSPDELEMVLLHELAHVRRWDNFVNLLQRCVESLLFFHPAVWLISNWARREREACCDATVVARTNRPHAYAELLVALAAQLPRSVLFHPAASSAMAAGPLRSRIRQILKLEEDPMLVSGKSLAVMLAGVITAATLVVLYLPTIGHAEPSEKQRAKSESAELEAPQKSDFALLKFELKRSTLGATELYLNGRTIDPNDLAKSLPSQKELAGDQYRVSVKAEPGVPYSDVIKLVDSLESAGLKKLSLDTRETAELNPDPNRSAQPSSELPYVVQFEKGVSKFLDGDEIMIDEIRGTAKTFEPGNNYQIKGKYKLHSHPEAQLSAFTTAREAKDGTGPIQSIQTKKISQGDADFTIILPMTVRGWPHLSFYANDNGGDFGGVYFGTGDTVLKEWWGSEKTAENKLKFQDGEYPYQVQFEKGVSKFLDGDDITINEIRGTAKEITPGNNYQIKGRYKLHSHPSASLSAFTTAKEAKDGTGPVQSIQTTNISQGDADFTIVLPMTIRGWPHLSFYAGGESIGGVYFGTGDTVLKDDAKDEERARFEHFEKSLKTIELVIAVFNDSAGYSHQLESVYKNLVKDHHSLDLWGSNVEPGSPDAERYHLTGAPTCIVFRNGQEIGRLAPIKDAEQLKRFIELAAGARKVTVKPDGSVIAEGLESYDANSAPRAAEESARILKLFKNIATSPTDASVYKLPAPLQTVFPELPELVKQMKEDPAHPQFAYNLKDSGTTLEVLAPKVVQEQYFEKRLSQWRDSANIPPTPAATGRSSKFPSLENQKLVDLAYKRLGLELEPITEADLKRVKALGYDGGVAVASGSAGLGGLEDRMIRPGDILVGLGVWPTTNMKSVAEILSRPEIAELNPVKFYAIRDLSTSNGAPELHDVVLNGRVEIQVAAPGGIFTSSSSAAGPPESNPYQSGVLGTYPNPFVVPLTAGQPAANDGPYTAPPLVALPGETTPPPRPRSPAEFAQMQSERMQQLIHIAQQTGSPPAPSTASLSTAATPVASPEELEILRERAKVIEDQMTLTAERYKTGRGATEVDVKRVAIELAVAESDLALAEGHHEVAIKKLQDSRDQAEQMVELRKASARAGIDSPDLEEVVRATRTLSDIKLKLIHLQKEATHPGPSDDRPQPASVHDGTNPFVEKPDGKTSSNPPLPASLAATPEQVLNAPKAKEADATQKHDSSALTAPQSHPYDVPNLETTPKYSPTPDPHSNPSADAPRVDSASDERSSRLARTDRGHSRTSSQSAAKEDEPSSDDRILVAYNIPAELVNDVSNMRDVSDMHGEFGSGGRYFLQATSERQKQFQQLLDAAPKWRDPEAAKSRAKQVYVRTEKDGQEYVEWQPAGLTFTSRANPKFAGPALGGGGWTPNGVAVAEVAPGSPADWNGIEPGDIMTNAGRFETKNLAELESLLKTQGQDYSTKVVHCFIQRTKSGSIGSFHAQLNLGAASAQPKPSGPINAPSATQAQTTNAPKTSTLSLVGSTDKSALRYDGKTFDEWRKMLTNELSTEKRIEAIKALAAFGRAGYAKEASQAILNVAGEYDFYTMQGDVNPEEKLKDVVQNELAPESRTQPMAKYWVPDIIGRLANDPQKWKWLAIRLLENLKTDDAATISAVEQLTKHSDADLRSLALRAIVTSDHLQGSGKLNDKTQQLLTSALQSKNPQELAGALNSLVFIPPGGGAQSVYNPALATLALDSSSSVQLAARNALKWLPKEDAAKLVDKYSAVLKDESRKADRVAAIRALGMLGTAAEPAVTQLEHIFLDDGQDLPSRVAAAFAVDQIEGGVRCQDLLLNIQNSTTDEKMKTRLNNLSNEERQLHNR